MDTDATMNEDMWSNPGIMRDEEEISRFDFDGTPRPIGRGAFLYIENPRIVRGFSKSFSVASSKSYSFRVRLDCGPSTAIKTLKEAI